MPAAVKKIVLSRFLGWDYSLKVGIPSLLSGFVPISSVKVPEFSYVKVQVDSPSVTIQ